MKRLLILLLIAVLVAGSIFVPTLYGMTTSAYAAGGDASDPVITSSYLEKTFTPELEAAFQDLIRSGLEASYVEKWVEATETVSANRLSLLQADTGSHRADGTMLFKKGDVLTIAPGCKVILQNGTVTADTSFLIDVTNGRKVSKLANLSVKTLYMMSDSDSGDLAVQSATCELVVTGTYRLSSSSAPDYGSLATALNTMGLFQGTGSSYALENSATRIQGLVMFLRILGLESAAASYQGSCPFTDVPKSHWAYAYVSYAYQNGLTNGTSATTFSPDRAITAQHYATFLLRALHYEEAKDFSYASALQDLQTLGLFSKGEVSVLSSGSFLRYKMVYLSYYGLFGMDQEAHQMLMLRLVKDGMVKESALYSGICQVNGKRIS